MKNVDENNGSTELSDQRLLGGARVANQIILLERGWVIAAFVNICFRDEGSSSGCSFLLERSTPCEEVLNRGETFFVRPAKVFNSSPSSLKRRSAK